MADDDGPFHGKHNIGPPEVSVRLHRLDRRSDKMEVVVEFANDSAIPHDLENVRGILFSSEGGSASPGIYEEHSEMHHISLPAGSSRHLSMTYEVGARPIDRLKIQVADGEATLHIGDLPHLWVVVPPRNVRDCLPETRRGVRGGHLKNPRGIYVDTRNWVSIVVPAPASAADQAHAS